MFEGKNKVIVFGTKPQVVGIKENGLARTHSSISKMKKVQCTKIRSNRTHLKFICAKQNKN